MGDPRSRLVAVHVQHAGAAFSESGAVILELEDNCVLAGHKNVLGRNAEVGNVRHVVVENGLPFLEHQRVAGRETSLRHHDSLHLAFGNDDLRGDARQDGARAHELDRRRRLEQVARDLGVDHRHAGAVRCAGAGHRPGD